MFQGELPLSRSTRLTLICHGVTAQGRKGLFPRDEPLEEHEIERARASASMIGHTDLILTSPALRARQTASALSLDAVPDEALADLGYGCWSGLSLADIHRQEPDALVAWMSDPAFAPDDGESIAALSARVSTWLETHKATGGHIVAITHAAVIRASILTLLDAPLSAFWKIDIGPLTATELTSDGRRLALRACGRPMAVR